MPIDLDNIKINFIKNDPVIWFLLHRLKLPYWGIPCVMFISSIILLFGIASVLGVYDSAQNVLQPNAFDGTKQHSSQLIISLFVQPVIVGYYLLFSQKVSMSYFGLLNSGVIDKQYQKDYVKGISEIESVFNSRKAFVVGLMVSIVATFWIIDLMSNDNFWYHKYKVVLWVFEVPKTFITSYAIAMIGLRVLIFQWGLSKIYSKIPTSLHPLHEDGAGGYASIGKLVGSYFYWILAGFGFYSAAGLQQYFTYGKIPEYLIAQLVVLPIVATIAFYLPLLSTHNEMQNSTRRLLARYNQKYTNIERQLFLDKNLSYNKKIEELFVLANFSEKTKKNAPTWPFNTQTLNSFLAFLGTSLLPLALSLFQKYILPIILGP